MDTKREHTIKVRLSESELAAIREKAGKGGVAGYLRSIGLGAQPAPRSRVAAGPKSDPALVGKLGQLGNLLNQIARRVNVAVISGEQLAVLVELAGIRRQLGQILARESHSAD
jgi:hypothetical protein